MAQRPNGFLQLARLLGGRKRSTTDKLINQREVNTGVISQVTAPHLPQQIPDFRHVVTRFDS